MDNLAYYLVAGVCLGAVYALIALGYTLVYGIIKLINFAHGEFCMVGAYAGLGVYLLLAPVGASAQPGSPGARLWGPLSQPALALPIILLISGLAGAAIGGIAERVAYRPIRSGGRLSALLTAIGVSLLLQNLAAFIHRGNQLTYEGPVARLCEQSLLIGHQGIRTVQFVYIAVSLVLTLALWYVVRRTRLGRAMRATSQDLDTAKLMGIDTDAVIRWTFMIGGFLGGIAGTLLALIYYVDPMMGFMPGLNAFVAAVVGGIGSIPGAAIGGFAMGLIQYLVVWAGVPTDYKDVAAFVVLILVLVVRPEGILGKRESEKV